MTFLFPVAIESISRFVPLSMQYEYVIIGIVILYAIVGMMLDPYHYLDSIRIGADKGIVSVACRYRKCLRIRAII